jgi:hypothetical protein
MLAKYACGCSMTLIGGDALKVCPYHGATQTEIIIDPPQEPPDTMQMGAAGVAIERGISAGLKARIDILEKAIATEHDEIEQILGKALGYPEYYPDISDVNDGSVCVGEHVPASLAEEAATKIRSLTGDVDQLKAAIRHHRDQRRDERCWLDDMELYKVLGEPVDAADLALPPRDEFLESCRRYWQQRQPSAHMGQAQHPMTIRQLEDALEKMCYAIMYYYHHDDQKISDEIVQQAIDIRKSLPCNQTSPPSISAAGDPAKP